MFNIKSLATAVITPKEFMHMLAEAGASLSVIKKFMKCHKDGIYMEIRARGNGHIETQLGVITFRTNRTYIRRVILQKEA